MQLKPFLCPGRRKGPVWATLLHWSNLSTPLIKEKLNNKKTPTTKEKNVTGIVLAEPSPKDVSELVTLPRAKVHPYIWGGWGLWLPHILGRGSWRVMLSQCWHSSPTPPHACPQAAHSAQFLQLPATAAGKAGPPQNELKESQAVHRGNPTWVIIR